MGSPSVIVSLALSASVDVTYEVDWLNHGGITRPMSVTRVAGGKALNVARVAAAVGAPVRVVAALGGSTGTWIAEQLTEHGISAAVVPLVATTRTCTAIVELEAKSETSTDIYEQATPLTISEWQAFAAVARNVISKGDWVAVSGSLPPGVPPDELAALLAELKQSGANIVVDSSGDGLRAMVTVASLIKVNIHEAGELLAYGMLTAAEACDALYERFGVYSIVTDGVRGAAAYTAEGPLTVPPATRLGRYPVGSGDSFLGGLLAALVSGGGWAAALDAAQDAAVRNALVPGPGILSAD